MTEDKSKIIGYFDSDSDIPHISIMLVQMNDRVVCSEIWDVIDNALTDDEIEVCKNHAVMLNDPLPIRQDHVLFKPVGIKVPFLLHVKEAETWMKDFVLICRENAKADPVNALSYYDRARRVSEEVEDIVRVLYLGSYALREYWFQVLENAGVGKNKAEKIAKDLGLL